MSSTLLDWTRGEPGIVYQGCSTCDTRWMFQRGFCPRCGSRPELRQASGRGSIHARTLVHRAPSEALRPYAPYLIVLVEADEGFRLMAHGDPELVIGDRVKVRFEKFGDALVPRFEKNHE
jgi:uncharacterized protein